MLEIILQQGELPTKLNNEQLKTELQTAGVNPAHVGVTTKYDLNQRPIYMLITAEDGTNLDAVKQVITSHAPQKTDFQVDAEKQAEKTPYIGDELIIKIKELEARVSVLEGAKGG